jgi:pilus assembly protein Flp/PilA
LGHPIGGNKSTAKLNQRPKEFRMSKFFARFKKDQSGATAIEYGLIAALIAVALITGAGLVGNNLNSKFNAIGNKIGTTVP